MAFTVGDRSIAKGRAVVPWQGVWSFEGRITGEADPPARGAVVVLTLGTLVLTGTVRDSGTHAGRPELYIVGGLADGWRRRLPRRPAYRDRLGVKLATVVADIAADAGERAVIAPELAAVVLGYAWTRTALPAASALGLVRVGGAPVPWHVQQDGSTWIGPRTIATVGPGEFIPRSILPAARKATVSTPSDDFAALLPGTLLGLPGLPADAPVRELAVIVTSDKAMAEVDL